MKLSVHCNFLHRHLLLVAFFAISWENFVPLPRSESSLPSGYTNAFAIVAKALRPYSCIMRVCMDFWRFDNFVRHCQQLQPIMVYMAIEYNLQTNRLPLLVYVYICVSIFIVKAHAYNGSLIYPASAHGICFAVIIIRIWDTAPPTNFATVRRNYEGCIRRIEVKCRICAHWSPMLDDYYHYHRYCYEASPGKFRKSL